MIKKVLVANRGEIAIRVMRACKELDIQTVAIYSTCDKNSLHVTFADDAICIGNPPPIESYLNMDRIIEVGKKTQCDAIHPGYGFLAENALFSKKCEDAGIIFIGPNSKALSLVGDKVASRETVRKVGGPIIPGMLTIGKGIEEFYTYAEKIGYPVLIKASMGGGGKGMRIVYNKEELKSSVDAGRREAKTAFGDESVYLEKYLVNPRHIEFQVLADNYGNVVHLFERECSLQRRYQKIVEETPSTALTNDLREKMGEVAKKIIKACGYNNAGTVEFLLDKEKKFYFLEVNARIQVEHPITEMVTGVDLVKQQILIASGEKLEIKQEDLKQSGHAIEARIYAEDPENNFMPSPGKILFVNEPQGPGIRVDSGIYSGFEVSPYYDPILSKLIVWSSDRPTAIKRLIAGLKNYIILGIQTNIPFLIDLVSDNNFINGNLHTKLVDEFINNWKISETGLYPALAISSFMMTEKEEKGIKKKLISTPWQELGAWEICSKYGV